MIKKTAIRILVWQRQQILRRRDLCWTAEWSGSAVWPTKHRVRVARSENSRNTCARSRPCARTQGLVWASASEWSFSLPSTSSSTPSSARAVISDFYAHRTTRNLYMKIIRFPSGAEPLLGSGKTRFWEPFQAKPFCSHVRNLVVCRKISAQAACAQPFATYAVSISRHMLLVESVGCFEVIDFDCIRLRIRCLTLVREIRFQLTARFVSDIIRVSVSRLNVLLVVIHAFVDLDFFGCGQQIEEAQLLSFEGIERFKFMDSDSYFQNGNFDRSCLKSFEHWCLICLAWVEKSFFM